MFCFQLTRFLLLLMNQIFLTKEIVPPGPQAPIIKKCGPSGNLVEYPLLQRNNFTLIRLKGPIKIKMSRFIISKAFNVQSLQMKQFAQPLIGSRVWITSGQSAASWAASGPQVVNCDPQCVFINKFYWSYLSMQY